MWVKLTTAPEGKIIFVNMDRFEKIEGFGDGVTRISALLSETEEDLSAIDVRESPEEIMDLMQEK